VRVDLNHEVDGPLPASRRDWEPPRLVELPAEATALGPGVLDDGFILT
jgi:hypothetical protein